MDSSLPGLPAELVDGLDSAGLPAANELFTSLGTAPDGGDDAATAREFAAIAPTLITHLTSSSDPAASLRNFARIVESVGPTRDSFYRTLADDPARMRAIGTLAGWSSFIAELISSVPGLVQIVFDLFEGPLADERIETLVGEGRRRIEASGGPEAALAQMRARELALIAIRDIEGLAPLRVSRAMSALAEAIVKLSLEIATEERSTTWGAPEIDGEPSRFAVLGCGKMGSGELVYGSDLDVIFVCDPGGICSRNSDRSGEEFWTRVAQRTIEILQQRRAYEVDTRLRPWGKQGPVVVNLNTLRNYWSEPRDIWERLAMTRIAPIAGDASLGHEASELIRHAALASPLPRESTQQVAQMRARMQQEQGSEHHVKAGPGGYVDAEFIAQYFSLGRSPSEVPPGAAIEHILLALSSAEVIPLEAAIELAESLRFLRRVEARLRLGRGSSTSSLPDGDAERARIAQRCGYDSCSEFDTAVADARTRSRRWFEELIGPLPNTGP